MRTHVSHGGFLTRIQSVTTRVSDLYSARFVDYGRLVNPKGHYADAPVVGLYQLGSVYIALL